MVQFIKNQNRIGGRLEVPNLLLLNLCLRMSEFVDYKYENCLNWPIIAVCPKVEANLGNLNDDSILRIIKNESKQSTQMNLNCILCISQ